MSELGVLGLDLSLKATGIALPDGSTRAIHPGARRIKGYARHELIRRAVLTAVASSSPDLVVIEDYAPHSPGINSTIALAELGGVIRTELTIRGYVWETVAPNTLKAWATGKGNASKDEMIDEALKRGAVPPIIHDEADAYLARLWGLDHLPKATTA